MKLSETATRNSLPGPTSKPTFTYAELDHDYAQLLAQLLTISAKDLRTRLALFEADHRLGACNAVLAAAAIAVGAEALVSADRAFESVPGIAHVVPDDAGTANC